MEPEKIMEQLSEETLNNLKLMSKVKSPEEKELYSRTIKNLCESLGVFMEIATNMMDLDIDDLGEF